MRGYRASPRGGTNVRPQRCSSTPNAVRFSAIGTSITEPTPVTARLCSAAVIASAPVMPETLSPIAVAM